MQPLRAHSSMLNGLLLCCLALCWNASVCDGLEQDPEAGTRIINLRCNLACADQGHICAQMQLLVGLGSADFFTGVKQQLSSSLQSPRRKLQGVSLEGVQNCSLVVSFLR